VRHPLIWFVKAWRAVISPLYGDVCRYYPSCSAYGLRSLETHGALKGSWLTVTRIARCHPWAAGGMDFVPGTPEAEQWAEEQRLSAATTGQRLAPDLGRDA
jgi:putative membrane protein insertion efficiency factor